MSSRKVSVMKRKSKVVLGTRKQEVDVKLKRPFLTGLMLTIGFGLGSAILGLLVTGAPIVYTVIMGYLAQ